RGAGDRVVRPVSGARDRVGLEEVDPDVAVVRGVAANRAVWVPKGDHGLGEVVDCVVGDRRVGRVEVDPVVVVAVGRVQTGVGDRVGGDDVVVAVHQHPGQSGAIDRAVLDYPVVAVGIDPKAGVSGRERDRDVIEGDSVAGAM